MISITMQTADINGHVILDDGDSKLGAVSARVSRTATLDGGCVITHSGLSQGDRTFRISTTIAEDQKTAIEYINENATMVTISCAEGLFSGSISSIDTSKPEMTMTILIKERL